VSWVGIGLAVGSVVFMPMLGIAKERLADRLGSAATKGEGFAGECCDDDCNQEAALNPERPGYSERQRP
jgi:hypothetical protein